MAFVPDYDWDVCVSAAHIDDAPDPLGRQWVGHLVKHLQHDLRQRLGSEVAVQFDTASDALAEPFSPSRSATMLAVASPAYANNLWTRKQFEMFISEPDHANRVFVAERFPPHAPDDEPAAMRKLARTKFWQRVEGSTLPLFTDDRAYFLAVMGLSDQLAQRLKALRAIAKSRRPPDIRPIRDRHSEPLQSNSAWKPTILSARMTEDHVFISHSSQDRAMVDAIVEHLETGGIRCWIAHRDIPSGANYQESIVEAIETAKAVVLAFSESANASKEVKKEIAVANGHHLLVLPLRLEDLQPSGALKYELAAVQYIDLFANRDAAIRRLIRTLSSHLRRLKTGTEGQI